VLSLSLTPACGLVPSSTPDAPTTGTTTSMSPLTFASWTRALSARGYGVLPSSHAVPVSLWLRDADRVLHFEARGTRLRLAAYRPTDLTTLILRAACDCAEHRQAGGTGRSVLNPGTVPLEVHELDGAAVFGWRGHEAALLPLHEAAGMLESLLARLPQPVLAHAETA
jgi:hypothetical protein